MMTIDLSCDVGENYPSQPNRDQDIMPYISSCHIACGFHSGDPLRMQKTIQLALENKVAIGAHPSYLDRENFGRETMDVSRDELLAQISYQVSALRGMVMAENGRLYHVKAHGALYHDLNQNQELAIDYVKTIQKIDPELRIFAFSNSAVIDACKKLGMAYIIEGFGDRVYDSVSELRSRKKENSMIVDQEKILNQVDHLLGDKIVLHNGSTQSISIDSICMHSDTANAVENTKAIHEHLIKQHVRISPSTGHTV